ncbi:MAG: hypothetical protein AYK22_02135 [Thermoplasmatales archaeon SG8-52-3]|nr:MAG: hypothetical protein AYK22_02135 [Thermoplasmatales archaeon SG8-52-3]
MKRIINRLTSNVERFEKSIKNISIRKRENIQKSMIRPLYQEILKSLFIVISLLIDALIPLEILRRLPFITNFISAIITISIFLFVEIKIYNILWGKNGRWSIENFKSNQKFK